MKVFHSYYLRSTGKKRVNTPNNKRYQDFINVICLMKITGLNFRGWIDGSAVNTSDLLGTRHTSVTHAGKTLIHIF